MAKEKAKEEIKEVAEAPKLVAVMSERRGTVLCPCGTEIKFRDVKRVSKEVSEWLLASFSGEFRVVEI